MLAPLALGSVAAVSWLTIRTPVGSRSRRLSRRGVPVVPDLVANAGGVISSYYEWVQNHQRVSWAEADERRQVLDRLDRTWEQIAVHDPEMWRDRALAAGITRVATAMHLAGQVVADGRPGTGRPASERAWRPPDGRHVTEGSPKRPGASVERA
jgi:hypothetical protein